MSGINEAPETTSRHLHRGLFYRHPLGHQIRPRALGRKVHSQFSQSTTRETDMPEELEQRISAISDELDHLWETSTKAEKLAVLVSLLAKRFDAELMTDMQLRGR
jgi:hypothetical protein